MNVEISQATAVEAAAAQQIALEADKLKAAEGEATVILESLDEGDEVFVQTKEDLH